MLVRSDAQLLREYAEQGRDSAFSELVARHTNLVYSAALRQVESLDLAAEVAQRVFIGLARGAATLSPKLAADASLAGWLCRSARNLSLNLRRDEFRRSSRERQAMAQHDETTEPSPDWEQLRPLIDEAMAELSDTDYDAIVLRFYEQKELRSVGEALGLSDDAAQKRVSRAAERLRAILAKRGVTIGASGLTALICVNAVRAAPVGLSVALSTAAAVATKAAVSAGAGAGAAAAATKTFSMTVMQKALVSVLLASVVSTGVYAIHHAREKVKAERARRSGQALVAPISDAASAALLAAGDLPPTVPISLADLLVPAEDDQWDRSAIFKIMPRGRQRFGGVQFQVDGVIQLLSTAARDDNRDYRRRVVVELSEATATAAGLQILQYGSNVAAAHLIGATRFGGEGQQSVAQLVWHYADGGSQASEIKFGDHVRDWVRQPYESPATLPYAFSKVIWAALVPDRENRWVRWYRFSYANPDPGRAVRSLELVSTMGFPNLFIAGLSLDPVALGERPDTSPNLEPQDAAPPAEIAVAVQSSEGLPIANARVRVQIEQNGSGINDSYERVQITDAVGVARVRYPQSPSVQRLQITASHDDYGGRKIGWESAAGDVIPESYILVLSNGISIGGWVADENDAPVSGAKLALSRFWTGGEQMLRRGEQSEFVSASTTSDAQGRWQAKGVPADLLDHVGIQASHPDYVGTNYFGLSNSSRDEQLRAGTFKVVLSRGSWVTGRVLDEVGQPITNATVTAGRGAYSDAREVKTDTQGMFRFQNLNFGRIQFSALANGHKPETRVVEVKPGMPQLVFRLGPGQVVRGIVQTDAGAPVPAVRISLENKNGGISDTYRLELVSDKDGRFEWDGAPDEPLNFTFIKSGFQYKRRQPLKPKEENVVTLHRTLKIEGWVLDATMEAPITKFRVGLGSVSGSSYFNADYPGLKAWVDPNGHFSLTSSEEASSAIKAEADDYAAQVEQLPEAQNDEVRVFLRLKPSLGLHGVLVTAEGAPVADGSLGIVISGQPGASPTFGNGRLIDRGGQNKVVTTSSSGEFALPSPPEAGTVIAAAGYGFGSASIQQVRETGRLALQPFGTIEGVFKRNGQPVAGEDLTLSMRDFGLVFDWSQYKTTSDGNGRFSFKQAPPGGVQIYRLIKTGPNMSRASYCADVNVIAGQTAQVELGDSGATLSGRARFETPPPDGEEFNIRGYLHTAVPPLTADLSHEQMNAEATARLKLVKSFNFMIGEDGSWNVDSVPPGSYDLGVTASKIGLRPTENAPFARGTAHVVVPDGATSQTQITVDEVVLRPVTARSSP